jgi:hypothetical protein
MAHLPSDEREKRGERLALLALAEAEASEGRGRCCSGRLALRTLS